MPGYYYRVVPTAPATQGPHSNFLICISISRRLADVGQARASIVKVLKEPTASATSSQWPPSLRGTTPPSSRTIGLSPNSRRNLRSPHLYKQVVQDIEAAWGTKTDGVRPVLPGVREMIESIPADRYAVATSGTKTYAYGAMTRVGITPPPVTITADGRRLKAGKPALDPFLLAAKCLGFDAKNCVVFEDSPSDIRAGVSGTTVIAVCTSHERSKIENCGAHFIVDDMRSVRCVPETGDDGMNSRFGADVSA
ncbi:hypothetical protein ACEPAH_7843 [Sanghuangporus vaninii]